MADRSAKRNAGTRATDELLLPRQRYALWMNAQGFTGKQIGRELNCTATAARLILMRARRRVLEAMKVKEDGDEEAH